MRPITHSLQRVLFLTIGICLLASGCAFARKESIRQAEEITLRIFSVGASNEAACTRISQALSEITRRELGIAVVIEQASVAHYDDELSRMQMLGDTPDLFCYMQPEDLLSYVEEQYVYRLDDMLDDVPWLIDHLPTEFWDCVQVSGSTYAVPANSSVNYCVGFLARTEVLRELGVDASTVTDWDQLHELLLTVKATYPEITPVVSHFGQIHQTLGQDPLGDNLGVLLNNQGKTVQNLYASEGYAQLCQQMHQWHEEGLIQKNAAQSDVDAACAMNLYNGFGFFVKLNEANLLSSIRDTELELTPIILGDTIANSSSVNLGWCISASCEYKQEAMALLELLYTNQAAADLCIYGQEGMDYRRLDEDTVTSVDELTENEWSAIAWGWGWPVQGVASVWALPGVQLPTLPTTGAYRSQAMGFVFDSTPVQPAVNRCLTVTDKYHNALMSGYLDPDEALPRFLQELEEAGIQDVIAQKQSQLDTWLAAR